MSSRPSGWAAGWSAFAGVVLIMAGSFQGIVGLSALFNDEFYVVGNEWVFQFDATTWGWIHLVLGIVLLASGFGIFTGNVAARSVGVMVAIVSGIVAFAWLPSCLAWTPPTATSSSSTSTTSPRSP